MSSLYGSIEALWSKMVMKQPSKQSKSIYEERINCFKKLIELQEKLKTMESGGAPLPVGTQQTQQTQQTQPDTQKEYMEYTNKYKKEYELCEIIMKPK